MKKLGHFILNEFENGRSTSLINEYRTVGSKNKSTLANVKMDNIDGKDADKNGTGGKMGMNEPVDPKVDAELGVEEINMKSLSKNEKRLLEKFIAEDDFFIVGKAGWGKTSIIKQFADKEGYKVITFYLDKAEASDLGGIPVATKNERTGKAEIQMAVPPFAAEIRDNPDQNYLLFFDEMNQAAPDVMNALMPIVLEHEIAGVKYDNFFCGAAGNFESENDAVNELSGPLKSRFKPLIVWETDTPESWKFAFKYLHKNWDDKVSKKLMDAFEEIAYGTFENPRELEHKIIEKYIWKLIQRKKNFPVDAWLDHLERVSKEKLDRTKKDELAKLAETIYNTVKAGGKEPVEKKEGNGRGSANFDINMIPSNVKEAVKQGMKYGYIEQTENGKKVKYGISRENVFVLDENMLNAEQMERLVNMFEADGIKFKFEKNSEWKEKGYKDPNED